MKIKLAGAGGGGTHLLYLLGMYLRSVPKSGGSHVVEIWDGDKYEVGNMSRQYFSGEGVGENKAHVKASELSQMFPEIAWVGKPAYIGPDNIDSFMSGDGTYMCCVDCSATKRLIDEYFEAIADNGLLLIGGCEETKADVQIHLRRGGQSLTPAPSKTDPGIKSAEGVTRGELSCEERAALPSGGQTYVANTATAQLMLNVLDAHLRGEKLPDAVFQTIPTYKMKAYGEGF